MGFNILIWAFLSLPGLILAGSPKIGPAEAEILSLEDCGNPETSMFRVVGVETGLRDSTTPVIGGTIIVNKTMDDTKKIKIVVDMKTETGWKEKYMTLDFQDQGFCTGLNAYFGDDWKRFLAAAEPPMTECPIQPNVYVGRDILSLISLEKLGVNIPYGKYQATAYIYEGELDGEEVGCLRYTIDCRPLGSTAASN